LGEGKSAKVRKRKTLQMLHKNPPKVYSKAVIKERNPQGLVYSVFLPVPTAHFRASHPLMYSRIDNTFPPKPDRLLSGMG
jgi:hypothetical protein